MTIDGIKYAIFNQNAVLAHCRHRKMKGAWEYFLVYRGGKGKMIKIRVNRYKSVYRWLYSRVQNKQIKP